MNFASRNAALYAAEASTGSGADCVILNSIEHDITAPADSRHVNSVDIYRAKSNGDPFLPVREDDLHPDRLDDLHQSRRVDRRRSRTRGPRTAIPSSTAATSSPAAAAPTPSIDHIGIRIFYTHTYVTPLQTFVGLGSSMTFDRSNVMRMEPIL